MLFINNIMYYLFVTFFILLYDFLLLNLSTYFAACNCHLPLLHELLWLQKHDKLLYLCSFYLRIFTCMHVQSAGC